MYKKILAAVNEHLNSEVAARYALHLARETKAKFYTCFVAQKCLSQHDCRAAEDAMKRLFIEAKSLNVHAESIAEMGDPVAEIMKIVRHEEISLVFAATRREDIERRFYAGTTARSLSLKLPCSTALVRVVHSGRVHPARILVPLKATVDHLTERAAFVSHMARAFGSRVFILHEPRKRKRLFPAAAEPAQSGQEARQPKEIAQFMARLSDRNIEHESRLLSGKTARNITLEAFAKRHDLIIMGASERNLFTSLIRGNPVEEVLRDSPCDLIILKPRHED